jgi:hypothetical protein
MPTCRLHVAVQTRSDRSYAFANGRYRRRTLLVNQRRSWRRTDKVDEVSGGLRLPAATHGELTSGKHPSELEPALRPLLTFTCSPQRMIRAFGRCAGEGWLDEFGGQLLLSQCVSVMSIIDGLHEVGVSSCRERGYEPEARYSDTPVCTLLVVAGSSTCSGSHAGCTHGMCMFGSAAAAYSAHMARISRVRMMAPRSGGARDSRRSHDLHARA